MTSTDDFRIRKTGRGYTIHQRVGNGWERLSDVHPTRAAAAAQFIHAAASINHAIDGGN